MLCGLLKPTSGSAIGGRHRRRPRSRGREAAHRLHVAAVLALRTADGARRTSRSSAGSTASTIAGWPRAARSCSRWPASRAASARSRATSPAAGGSGWPSGCAILHEPTILFLDEPTGGVDPVSRRQFWQLIDRLSAQGVTVFVTTHYLDEAEHCHRLALMHAGRIAALGTVAELKQVFHDRAVVEVRTPLADGGAAGARRPADGREDQPLRHGAARVAEAGRAATRRRCASGSTSWASRPSRSSSCSPRSRTCSWTSWSGRRRPPYEEGAGRRPEGVLRRSCATGAR